MSEDDGRPVRGQAAGHATLQGNAQTVSCSSMRTNSVLSAYGPRSSSCTAPVPSRNQNAAAGWHSRRGRGGCRRLRQCRCANNRTVPSHGSKGGRAQERGLARMGGRENRVRISEPRRELRGLQHRRKQVPAGNSHPVSESESLHSEVHDARRIRRRQVESGLRLLRASSSHAQ